MRYCAFLRAINVGRNNRVTMADLRDLCAGLGFGNVGTYLQSGNLVFDADAPAGQVTRALEEALSKRGLERTYPVVREQSELHALSRLRPFGGFGDEHYRRYVTLFRDPLPAGVSSFISGRGFEITGAREREVFWVVEAGQERGVDAGAARTEAWRAGDNPLLACGGGGRGAGGRPGGRYSVRRLTLRPARAGGGGLAVARPGWGRRGAPLHR
ncbi:MAG: DUF1697 domain-containing protein [Dehalococcoidia bacterium]|nr:DUF1697 domain-containing protein [Dehalococcoidia bacterium]